MVKRDDTNGLATLSVVLGLTAAWVSLLFVLAVLFPKQSLAAFNLICRYIIIPIMTGGNYA